MLLSALTLAPPSADAQSSATITELGWNDDYLVARFGSSGYEVEWTRDGDSIGSSANYGNTAWWLIHDDVFGEYCVRARVGNGAWTTRCMAHTPTTFDVTETTITVSWPAVTDPSVVTLLVLARR